MTDTQNRNGLHAEYKIPGGKLLVLDLDIVNNHLANVQLSGDFFMEPPEALDVINNTLEGLPLGTTDEDVISKLSENLGTSVTLYGITLEGVAVVLQRALA